MNREERVFSVTMTEDELRLFSEFLEQREYSKEEEIELKKLRYEDPDQYLKEVEKYRETKRSVGRDAISKGLALGAVTLGTVSSIGQGRYNMQGGSGIFGRRDTSDIFDGVIPVGVTGALGGSALGVLGGGIVNGITKIRYNKGKDRNDQVSVLQEKRLKKEDPKEYQRIKSEQEDTIRVMEGKMTKKEFKKKHGHRPDTKV